MNASSGGKNQEVVRFAHFTDLHVGMSSQKWMWPSFKKAFLDDLERMCIKLGVLDFVIFSGDLTQKSSKDEYAKLTDVLSEIWAVFRKLGQSPALIPVPGNHDLLRPLALNPTAKVLSRWWETPDLLPAIWTSEPADYRALVNESFVGYMEWLKSLDETSITLPSFTHGEIPGDISTKINCQGGSVGIVGLNSAWLQLGDGDYKERLHVDPMQLIAVTSDTPDEWCSNHDFNLLVTHHPQEWLHPSSLDSWRSEIYIPSRFDGHLFGHMHESNSISTSEGGAVRRRHMQGASLFGLEFFEKNGLERIHGYSIYELENLGSSKRIKHWPRKSHKTSAGHFKLIQNPEFDCNDDGYAEEEYKLDKQSMPVRTNILESPVFMLQQKPPKEALRMLRENLSKGIGFSETRNIERVEGIAALTENRALWIVSDWGLGTREFIGALHEGLDVGATYVYKIDCQNFFSKSEIYSGIEEQLGICFEQLLSALASEPVCTLVFDDAPVFEGKDKSARALQQEIESLISIVLDFCDNARVIVVSRLPPVSGSIKSVELRPLDELDTKSYVSNHEKGGSDLAAAQFISQLHRHTDGIPSRIDMVLRDIQIVGAAQLHSLNADVVGKHAATETAPSGLALTLDEIQKSSDPNISRAFELLKALAMFPRGEQLETVKRFNQTSVFYPQDASYLKDFALLDFVEVPSLGSTAIESARALVVRRVVREYLYANLSTSEFKGSGRRALEIYFGQNWDTRAIKLPKGMKFNDRNCGAWKIGNASLLVLRAVRESVEHYTAQKCQSAIALATSFCKKLYEGNHFRAVISLCDDIMPLIRQLASPPNTSILTLDLAESQRMTGEYEKSKALCLELITFSGDKIFLQRVYACLAQCHEALKDTDSAIKAANECIKIDKRSKRALSAQSMLVRLDAKISGKFDKLAQLEKQARSRKALVTANNIKLSMAENCSDAELKESLVSQVSRYAELEGDIYNAMRANISLAEIYIKDSRGIDRGHLSKLIEIYHYLYGEWINRLFNKCHKVLWCAFVSNNDTLSLLRLFRSSSLRWRLSGAEDMEVAYIEKLNNFLTKRLADKSLGSSRELIYLISRNNQAAKLLADKSS